MQTLLWGNFWISQFSFFLKERKLVTVSHLYGKMWIQYACVFVSERSLSEPGVKQEVLQHWALLQDFVKTCFQDVWNERRTRDIEMIIPVIQAITLIFCKIFFLRVIRLGRGYNTSAMQQHLLSGPVWECYLNGGNEDVGIWHLRHQLISFLNRAHQRLVSASLHALRRLSW